MYTRNSTEYYLKLGTPPVSGLLANYALGSLSGRILDFGGATGGYSKWLYDNGLDPVCVDINRSYLKRAAPIPSVAADTTLPFKSGSFDGAICFEVLEHLENPAAILAEFRRCVRGRVVVSVPNCRDTKILMESGLTYDHFMELDHRNFFDKDSLGRLLGEFYDRIKIHEIMPAEHFLYGPGAGAPGRLINKILRAQMRILRNLGIIKRLYFTHLVAICENQ